MCSYVHYLPPSLFLSFSLLLCMCTANWDGMDTKRDMCPSVQSRQDTASLGHAVSFSCSAIPRETAHTGRVCVDADNMWQDLRKGVVSSMGWSFSTVLNRQMGHTYSKFCIVHYMYLASSPISVLHWDFSSFLLSAVQGVILTPCPLATLWK